MRLSSRRHGNVEARLNFWPAYVDLMVVLALTSILAFSITEGKRSQVEKYKEDAEKVMATLKQKLQKSGMKLSEAGDGIILGDSVVSFATGAVTPDMSPEQEKIFFGVWDAIKESIDQVPDGRQAFDVVIEGHTDTVPINTEVFPSNWELSAARATNILRMMLAKQGDRAGFQLKAIGYGETRPIDFTNGPSIKNRRIEIKILPNYERLASKKAPPEEGYLSPSSAVQVTPYQ